MDERLPVTGEPMAVTAFGTVRVGPQRNAAHSPAWLQSLETFEDQPMDKLFLYMPVWAGSTGENPYPSDTVRLMSYIGPPGTKVRFNEGTSHGHWYMTEDRNLVIQCAWGADHTGPSKVVRFYPIAGTLAWASLHEPIAIDGGGGGGGPLPLTFEALLVPFVEGSYPHDMYPVNLGGINVRPLHAQRARAASLNMVHRGQPVDSAEEVTSESVMGSRRRQRN